jgi:hypothetical protein
MSGHVLHLCNLHCDCLSQPFPSLSYSVHISHFISAFLPHLLVPPKFPYAFLTVLCAFWHICCLDTEFECIPLLLLPFWRYRWSRLMSPKSPKHSYQKFFTFCCMSLAKPSETQGLTENRISSVPTLKSLDLGTFRVALLVCQPQTFWHRVIVIPGKCWDASPSPRPTATQLGPGLARMSALSNPTKFTWARRVTLLLRVYTFPASRTARPQKPQWCFKS